jgi:hypothetical protein
MIYSFLYSLEDAKKMHETLLYITVTCPEIEVAKYIIMMEKIIATYDNLYKFEDDAKIRDIRLKIDEDSNVLAINLNEYIPKKKYEPNTGWSQKKLDLFNKKAKGSKLNLKALSKDKLENLDLDYFIGVKKKKDKATDKNNKDKAEGVEQSETKDEKEGAEKDELPKLEGSQDKNI